MIREIYRGLQNLGFHGGRIIEPAIGTGHFVGAMPSDMASNSKVVGCELDDLTARIARQLYPESVVIQRGFQDLRLPRNHFDAMVGNPPFGSQSVFDPEHETLSRFSIHNYFIAKSLYATRPGGVMAFVVSRHFMDAGNPEVRNTIANDAHFLGAIRLPETAFKANAGAEVTTDIVFLQKATRGEETDRSWTETVARGDEGKEFTLNQWFADRPHMMLGEMVVGGGQFGDSVSLVAPGAFDLASALQIAIDELPRDRYTAIEREETAELKEQIEIPDTVRIGGLFVASGGRIARRIPDIFREESVEADYEWYTPRNEKATDRIRGMIGVRNVLRGLMVAEQDASNDDGDLQTARDALNRTYDAFVGRHGHLNSQANRLAMQDDPDYPLLQALEKDYDRGITAEIAKKHGVDPREPSAAKAAIFTKRVVRPRRQIVSVDTARDALLVSMNELGRVDMNLMMRLSGKNEEEIVTDLSGLIFLDPLSEHWETRDKYLTGNVKEKLKAAELTAHKSERYASNIAALRAVQPLDIEPVDILVQLGSTWIPPKDVNDFVTHLLGPVHRNIDYSQSIGKWLATIRPGNETLCKAQWGTVRRPANVLIEDILTHRDIKVQDEVGRDPSSGSIIYRLNETETAAANQKADEIRQAFGDWIWEGQERRERLAKQYNEKFNTNVAPSYDGSHLELPGTSPSIVLRQHQKNAIWRGIQEGSTLFDHVVGAGKTYEMIATGMESKRMGLMSKPMYVVPNHLLLQWKDAFYELYPSCNLLIAEKEDFEKSNRQRLFSKIATGDWDAVVVAHSSFKKIPVPEETLHEILEEQIEDLTDAILASKREGGDRITIKEMEKAKDRMEAKIKRAAETGPKDNIVTFADLGVDALFVDELHEFKNLMITTSMSRISGLGNLAGSEKAFDMFVKARYLQKKNNGRGFFGGTGTPISNTIAEEYTVQRYFQYDDMKRRGINAFDSWASTFGQVVAGWELDSTGVNYKLNTRFSKFQNVPELTAMYRSFADVITKHDLVRQAAERGERPLTPPIRGGRPRNIVVERSPLQARFMGELAPVLDEQGNQVYSADGIARKEYPQGSIIYRMEHLPKDPSIDNPLKITNEARKAGLDYRLIDPSAADFADSKINKAVDEIYRIWDTWNELKGTQLVFCDLSTPRGAARFEPANERGTEASTESNDESTSISMDELLSFGHFSVYEDVKQKLINRGIPEDEIRFIHDAKTDLQKAKLFADMNAGRVRIMMGSTPKMGAGTNVQQRLVAEHDLDAPWRPSDLEQRMGRIERQGNMFYRDIPGFEIEIIRYATKQTYDSRMWQTIEYKAAAIEQFRRGDTLQRVIEDVAGESANAADMKAAASGNPLILLQVQIAADLKKLEAVFANWKRTRYALESRAVYLEKTDARADERVAIIQQEIDYRDEHTKDAWEFVDLSGKAYSDKQKPEIASIILEGAKQVVDEAKHTLLGDTMPRRQVGQYRGYKIAVEGGKGMINFTLRGLGQYKPENLIYAAKDDFNISGFFQRVDNYLGGLETRQQIIEQDRTAEKAEFLNVRDQLGKPFVQEQDLKDLREDNGNVLAELRKLQGDENYVSTWLPKAVEAPQELREAVESARSMLGTPASYPPAVEEAIGVLEKIQGDPEAGLTQLLAIAFAKLDSSESDALVPSLIKALNERPGLAEKFVGDSVARILPTQLRAAIDEATGYSSEENRLALDGCRMIMGKALNPSGNFVGEVIGISPRCVLQEIQPGIAVIHRRCDFDNSTELAIGARATFQYGDRRRLTVANDDRRQVVLER